MESIGYSIRLQRVLDDLQDAVDIGWSVCQREAVMTRAAAVVVKINAASGRLAAELQHQFATVAEAVAIALNRLASAERQAKAAAVNLKTTRDGAAFRDVVEATRQLV